MALGRYLSAPVKKYLPNYSKFCLEKRYILLYVNKDSGKVSQNLSSARGQRLQVSIGSSHPLARFTRSGSKHSSEESMVADLNKLKKYKIHSGATYGPKLREDLNFRMLEIFGDKWHKLFGKFELVKLISVDNLDVAEDITSNKEFNIKQLRPEKQRLAQDALRDYKIFEDFKRTEHKITKHLINKKGKFAMKPRKEDKSVVFRDWQVPRGLNFTREPFLGSPAIDKIFCSQHGSGNEVGIPIKMYQYATGLEAVMARLKMSRDSSEVETVDILLRKYETAFLVTFAANATYLNKIFWKFLSRRDPFIVHGSYRYIKWFICAYILLKLSMSQDEVVIERASRSYPIEAAYVENIEWDGTSRSDQLDTINNRSDLEKFGKDWLVYDFTEKDTRFSNPNIISPQITYFDESFISSGYRDLMRLNMKYLTTGLKSLSLSKINVVHLEDRIIFRFEREQTRQSSKMEHSLLVLYLEQYQESEETPIRERILKIGYYKHGLLCLDPSSTLEESCLAYGEIKEQSPC